MQSKSEPSGLREQGTKAAFRKSSRLLQLEVTAREVVQEAPEIREEAPLRFPNAKAQRRLARTLDQFIVKARFKPLITDYGYPEGLTLDSMVGHRPPTFEDLCHSGTCAASGPSGSSSVKAKGQLER